jgi:hypothetical protein
MEKWNALFWVLLIAAGVGVLGLIAFVGALMVASGIIFGYVTYLILLALLFTALSVIFPK